MEHSKVVSDRGCISSSGKEDDKCSTQAIHTCSDSRLERKKLQKLLRLDYRPEISTSTSYWRAFPDLLADYVGDMEKKDDVSSVFYR